jgi:PKD repeat protein
VTLTETVAIPAVAPNTYFFFVTVDDDHILAQSNTSNDTLQSDPIRVRTSCTTECAATVVATAAAGNIVGFTLTNAPSCAGASVVWNFGDGVTAVGDTTSHTYSAAGTYTWSVTVTASGAGSCQSSGTITIVGSGAPKRRRAVGH